MKDKGLFLSLDGLDGTGKSTQCQLLAQWLRDQSFPITQCVDPGGTKIGKQIRELLLDRRQEISLTCEMLLFMASRAQLTQEIIKPALEAGRIVISDRYLLANVVYQGHAGGLDVAQLWSLGILATDGLQPDRIFVLDLPIHLAERRRKRKADRMESRDQHFQQKVRDGFLKEAEAHPDKIVVIDASQSKDEVQNQIRDEVAKLLGQRDTSQN